MEHETTDSYPYEEFEIEANIGNQFNPKGGASENDNFSRDIAEYPLVGLNNNLRSQKHREIKKRAVGIDGAATKARHEKQKPILTGYDILRVAKPRFNQKELSELFEKDDTHFAAIRVKASNVVGIGYDLVDSNATRRKKDALSEDAEKKKKLESNIQNAKFRVFEQLDALNEDNDFIDTLEQAYLDYEITGNGYIEIGRTALGRIGYAGYVPAHTMRVRIERDGFVQMIDDKPVFFRNFGDTETEDPIASDPRPNEMIHFKKFNPNDLYYGMPDIIPAINAVAGNHFADAYNLDYFENKAVPRHLVVLKGGRVGESAQENLMKFFGESLKGQHHRTLLLQLPPDWGDRKSSIEINPVESGDQEASFGIYHKKNVERILMVHRVPVVLLGTSENVPHAVGRMADKSFKELTVRPTQRKWEKKVNGLVAEFTNIFKFKLNELTLTDEQQQAAIDTAYYNMNALLPNEVRARWGWPGLPEGDKTMQASNPKEAAQRETERQQEQHSRDTNARTRDKQDEANRTDSTGEARNVQGEGRTSSR